MKSLRMNFEIDALFPKVWRAITSVREIEKWTEAPAVMPMTEGFEFSLYGGEIKGTNIILIPKKKIVQEWDSGKWIDGPSAVTMCFFEPEYHITLIQVLHEGEFEGKEDVVETGWRRYYMGPLQYYLRDHRTNFHFDRT